MTGWTSQWSVLVSSILSCNKGSVVAFHVAVNFWFTPRPSVSRPSPALYIQPAGGWWKDMENFAGGFHRREVPFTCSGRRWALMSMWQPPSPQPHSEHNATFTQEICSTGNLKWKQIWYVWEREGWPAWWLRGSRESSGKEDAIGGPWNMGGSLIRVNLHLILSDE